MNRYMNILTAFILTIAIVFQQPVYVTAEEANLRLYAKAAVLMDADSGRVLYDRCGDE